MIVVIVEAFDKEVFKRNSTAAIGLVFLNRTMQGGKRLILHAGHKGIAGFLDGGMQGNRQNELLRFRAKCSNAIENAARRNRDMASADIEPIFTIQETKGCKGVAVIQKRLALAHDNHIAHAGAHIVLSKKHLLDNFSREQITGESLFTRGAERTRHRATDL